jgi:hypothetical protein
MKQILIALLLLPFVTGLGVSPAVTEFFDPQEAQEVTLRVYDAGGPVSASVEGELAPYISVDGVEQNEVVLVVNVTDTLPPGATTGMVTVRSAQPGTGQIAASVAATARVSVRTPQSGPFVTARFLASSLERGRTGSIPLEVENVGDEDVGVTASVTVEDERFVQETWLASGERDVVGFDWVPPRNGRYDVRGNVSYANDTVALSKTVTVGDPSLVVDEVGVELDDGLRLDMNVSNEWDDALETFVTASVVRDGTEVISSPAPVQTVPSYDARVFSTVLDTPSTGNYSLDIRMEYGDDESVTRMPLRVTDAGVYIDGAFTPYPGPPVVPIAAAVIVVVTVILAWERRRSR